jgi:hypothetical protein
VSFWDLQLVPGVGEVRAMGRKPCKRGLGTVRQSPRVPSSRFDRVVGLLRILRRQALEYV